MAYMNVVSSGIAKNTANPWKYALGSGYLLRIFFPDLGYQNYDYREVIFYVFLKFYIKLFAIALVWYS
jgi:hypothetical protein